MYLALLNMTQFASSLNALVNVGGLFLVLHFLIVEALLKNEDEYFKKEKYDYLCMWSVFYNQREEIVKLFVI